MSEFNLLYEPWVKALGKDGSVTEISIKNVLQNAREYVSFAGENKLQDVAILRLFSSIVVTMLYEYDNKGKEHDLRQKSIEEIVDLYKEAWVNGLSRDTIEAFCDRYEERFYLFDDEHPFMQVAKDRFKSTDKKSQSNKPNPYGCVVETESEKGLCTVNYLKPKTWVGTILESGNSRSPFSNYSNPDNLALSYAEAARWLVWFMNFSTCAIKNRKFFNSKMTWSSKGALVSPIGRDLHETIMLNSVLLVRNEPYEEINPIWKRETTPFCTYYPYGENGHPNNLPELYTQQSRKVRLCAKDGAVIGMFATSGDDYDSTDAFAESMFIWRQKTDKTTGDSWCFPIHRSDTVPVWKDVSSIMSINDAIRPGVVNWVGFLYEHDVIDPGQVNIPYQITDVFYGTMNCSLDKTIENELIINKKYFDSDVVMDYVDVISVISKLSSAVTEFVKDMEISMGGDDKRLGPKTQKIKLQYERVVGEKSLACLEGIISVDELKEFAFSYAEKLVNSFVDKAPISAYIGHEISCNGGKSKEICNLAKAEKMFRISVYKLKKKENML